ncbi:UNVERIFIED_ORG: LacI family transcriptional regulator [Martelella mediterranea]
MRFAMQDDEERPGRPVTSTDVARRAGVSRSAVSRTFTAGASVAPETRERVMKAARELGYRVNMLARGLTQKRTHLVGLVVSDIDNSFRSRLVDKLSRGLVALDYHPFILPTDPGQNVSHLIDMMLHYNVSGAIVTSDTPPVEIAEECAAFGVPLVLVNKPRMSGNVASIIVDCEKTGRLAAEALHETGCRRVAIAGQRRPSHTISLRKEAFRRHCTRLGMECVAAFSGAIQNYAGGIEAAAAFIDSGETVDGMFCVNDYLALGFLDEIRRATSIAIPEALSVVACDDIDEAAWLSYDLTTIRQDTGLLADAALSALIARIDTPSEPPLHAEIDVTLVRRGSTAFIRSHPS